MVCIKHNDLLEFSEKFWQSQVYTCLVAVVVAARIGASLLDERNQKNSQNGELDHLSSDENLVEKS